MQVPRDTSSQPFPQPGTWRPITIGAATSAFFRCPKCPTYGSFFGTHEIAADGTVTPSVACPNCDFHDSLFLEGWTP